jgi:CobQ-like glutamine amidotransferase family enzyme
VSGPSTVRVVDVLPDLLGTYGDSGNALILAQRLRWRGFGAEVVRAPSGSPLPACADIYCLGGGEDGPQAQAAAALAEEGALARAVAGGGVVLAVCAGFQIIGMAFAGADGLPRAGVGLIDVASRRGEGRRAVGEILVETPLLAAPLTGYENHGGITELGPGVAPLGRVLVGVGNGTGEGTEGVVAGRVVGTYLHGPVLARNPALADHLLQMVAGPLPPLEDPDVDDLRAERLAAVGSRWRRLRPQRARQARETRRTYRVWTR